MVNQYPSMRGMAENLIVLENPLIGQSRVENFLDVGQQF